MDRRGEHRETRERGNLFLVSAVKSDTARAVYSWARVSVRKWRGGLGFLCRPMGP